MDFENSYRSWALLNCEAEVDSGFPNLKAVTNQRTSAVRTYSEKVGTERTKSLLKALVRSRFPSGSEGLSCSEEDGHAISKFREHFESQTPFGAIGRRCQKKIIKATVCKTMRRLGRWTALEEGDTLVYVMARHSVVLTTRFHLGARSYDLAYEHWLSRVDMPPFAQGVSVLGWLGLGQTTWENLAAPDVEGIVSILERNIPKFSCWAPSVLGRD